MVESPFRGLSRTLPVAVLAVGRTGFAVASPIAPFFGGRCGGRPLCDRRKGGPAARHRADTRARRPNLTGKGYCHGSASCASIPPRNRAWNVEGGWQVPHVLFVEIPPGDAVHVVGTKDGRSWDFWNQQAYVSSGNAYPSEVQVHPLGGKAYPPGWYLVGAGGLRVDRRGVQFNPDAELVPLALAVDQLRDMLKPVPAPAAGGAARASA